MVKPRFKKVIWENSIENIVSPDYIDWENSIENIVTRAYIEDDGKTCLDCGTDIDCSHGEPPFCGQCLVKRY